MPDNVEILEDKCLIQIKTYGHTNIEDMRGSLNVVSEMAVQKNICSILVDAQELVSLPDTSELYQFVNSLPDQLKVAIVVPDPKRSKDIEDISSVFEVQSTLDTFESIGDAKDKSIRLFLSRIEALNWLGNNA